MEIQPFVHSEASLFCLRPSEGGTAEGGCGAVTHKRRPAVAYGLHQKAVRIAVGSLSEWMGAFTVGSFSR